MKIYDYNGRKNICGNRVHEARCRQHLTQSELAARLQVEGIIIERDSISRIEIGTRFVADYELNCFASSLLRNSLIRICKSGFVLLVAFIIIFFLIVINLFWAF